MDNEPETPRTAIYKNNFPRLILVVLLLCCCYFGKYFCTSDMYVVKADFQHDMKIDDEHMAMFFSLGYFWSMFGKVSAGVMSDSIGGYIVTVGSVIGYIVPTILFSFVPGPNPISFYAFLFIWSFVGYAALGLAWVAVVAVATNWIPQKNLGTIMSFLSMAPQLGDVLARVTLAPCLGLGWRNVFRIAALIAFGLFVPILLFVRNEPPKTVEVEKKAAKAKKEEKSYMQRLKPLLMKPVFWAICFLSGSLYGTRTLFLLYSNNFLAASYCLGQGSAYQDEHGETWYTYCTKSDADTQQVTATTSAVYTLLGCLSVIIIGVLKDKLPQKHRATTLVIFIIPLFVSMVFLAGVGAAIPYVLAAGVVALTGFALFGPYKVLGAVFAVDVGGKELKSTCTAFMGVFDNFTAIVMLFLKGSLGDNWTKMFLCLSGFSFLSLLCASFIWYTDLFAVKARESLEEPFVEEEEEEDEEDERTRVREMLMTLE